MTTKQTCWAPNVSLEQTREARRNQKSEMQPWPLSSKLFGRPNNPKQNGSLRFGKEFCNMTLQKMTFRIGFGAAVFNILGGLSYLVILTIMIATKTPMSDPSAPPLVAASVLMLIGPLGLIPLWSAIYLSSTEDKMVFSLISLIFVTLFSAATSINRWVHLTVVREFSGLGY